MDKILPGWMLEKPELVCPPNSIQKGDLIGSGQYGSVYKGYYIQGTARFVRAKNIFHYLLLCKGLFMAQKSVYLFEDPF